jgi:sugar phosphate isomerase/epimerase
LREIGYRKVEAAGTAGLTAAAFRALLDRNHIRATSAHVGIPQPLDAAAWAASLADAKTLGVPTSSTRSSAPTPPARSGTPRCGATSRWTSTRPARRAGRASVSATTTTTASSCRWRTAPAGAVRRPHVDGRQRLVGLEIDIYWAWRGAADPVDLSAEDGRRVRQFHVKDMNIDSGFADPGTGLIDFGRVFAQGDVAGIKEFIVERDDAGTGSRTPAQALDTAAVGYEFLRNIRF